MDIDKSQDAGSAPEENAGSKSEGSAQEKKDFVKYESFDKLVGQLKRQKEMNEQLNQKVQEFELEKRRIEESKLAEQGEYKKLLEMRTSEISQLSEQLESERRNSELANKTLIDAQKLQAVYEELPGRVRNPSYMQFIDLDQVAYDPETGRIDRESAKLAANYFAEEHSALIDTSHIGRLPGNSAKPSVPLKDRYKDMPLSEMRKNVADAVRQARQEQGI